VPFNKAYIKSLIPCQGSFKIGTLKQLSAYTSLTYAHIMFTSHNSSDKIVKWYRQLMVLARQLHTIVVSCNKLNLI